MTETKVPSHIEEESSSPEQEGRNTSSYGMHAGKYSSRFVNIERRVAGDSAFPAEDDVFYSSVPRPSHWSIAWSDLMMTMFVLFLCMFVYKAANEEFLGSKTPEIIGGDTTDALQTTSPGNADLPFSPIYPGVPLMTAGTIKKVETPPSQEPLREEADNADEQDVFDMKAQEPAKREEVPQPSIPDVPPQTKISVIAAPPAEPPIEITARPVSPKEDEIQPRPLVREQPREIEEVVQEPVQEDIYNLSKEALEDSGLEKFAAIDLVPDQTMRIILTSDLLFALGRSELSSAAQNSLRKIGSVIKNTPYMINVVGHTDNIPMVSSRFASNWELSVARASTVARFLINELAMNPNQFVVSGYSSYRPLVPNNTAENRARNRRVEIIISKKLPQPLPASAENLR